MINNNVPYEYVVDGRHFPMVQVISLKSKATAMHCCSIVTPKVTFVVGDICHHVRNWSLG